MRDNLKTAINLIGSILFLVIVIVFSFYIWPDLKSSQGALIFSFIVRGIVGLSCWGIIIYRIVKKWDDFSDFPLFVEILIKVIIIAFLSCLCYDFILNGIGPPGPGEPNYKVIPD